MEKPLSEDILKAVQELEEEQRAEEAPSQDADELLRVLQSGDLSFVRRDAAERLGSVEASSPQVVQALIAAREADSDLEVRGAAAKALRSPVHQACLQQLPALAAEAESALQQVPDSDWLKGTLSGRGEGTHVQRRIYPKLRLLERPLLVRIFGMPFALIGLGLLVVAAAVVLEGALNLTALVVLVVGLGFTYAGLFVVGLDLKAFFLAVLHRRAWRGPQATAEGRITHRAVEEHKHESEYGGISYTYTYWIWFRFPTTEGPVSLKAEVDERRYDQLERGQPVKVRYAQGNPRLALLEWEWKE